MGMIWSLLTRTPLKVDVVRDRSVLARMVGQGQVENVYRLQIMNATESTQQYVLAVAGMQGIQIVSEAKVSVDAASSRWVPVRLQVASSSLKPGSYPITFPWSLKADAQAQVGERSVFLAPR